MADTDIKIKLTADPKPVRDAIKLIDKDLKELGGPVLGDDSQVPPAPPDNQGNTDGQTSPTTNSDRVNQSRRDRVNRLILRELTALRRELQKSNQNRTSPPPGTPPGPNPPPSGGPNPPPPPGDNGGGSPDGGDSDSGNPIGDNSKIIDAIGKLSSLWSLAGIANAWGQKSLNREELAYKTYGSLLTYDDYNIAGRDASRAGVVYGYGYEDVMHAQKANMRYAGFQNLKALGTDTEAILSTSAAYGLDTNQVATASGRMTGFGTFKIGEQQKFANMLAQAIQEHGMQGREDQELQVLQNISESLASRNTTVTEDMLRSGANLYGALANVNPNLRGERGGNLAERMMDLANSDDKALDVAAGLGTKYTGISGYLELKRLKETDPQAYFQQAYSGLQEQFKGVEPERIDEMFRYKLVHGSGFSVSQADDMLKAIKSGGTFDLNRDTAAGEEARDKILAGWNQDRTLSEGVKYRHNKQAAEEEIGNVVNAVKSPFWGMFNDMSQGGQIAATAAMTAIPAIGGGLLMSKLGGLATSGLSGILGGAGGAGGGLSSLFGGINAANAGKLVTGAKIGGSIITGGIAAYNTYDNLQKGDYRGASESAAGGIGAIGGGLAGAKIGAGIGTLFGGPLGTIIGGLIGGGIGALAGNFLGEKGGGLAYDILGGDDEDEHRPEETGQEKPSSKEHREPDKKSRSHIERELQENPLISPEKPYNKGAQELRRLKETDPQSYYQQMYSNTRTQFEGANPAHVDEMFKYKLVNEQGFTASQADEMMKNIQSPRDRFDTRGMRDFTPRDQARIVQQTGEPSTAVLGTSTYVSGKPQNEMLLAHNPALMESRGGMLMPLQREESANEESDNRGTLERQFRLMEQDTRSTVDNTKALQDNTKALEKNNKSSFLERLFGRSKGGKGTTPTSTITPVVSSTSPVTPVSPSQAGGIKYGDYAGENGGGEGKYWKRQNDRVSFKGAQDGLMDALDMLGKFYHDKTGNTLIVTAGTNGNHPSNGTPYGHDAGYKFDINDWGENGGAGALTGDNGAKGWFTDELIKYGRSLGLGMNWEGDHIDVSLVGDQWDGNGGNAGGFKRPQVSASSTVSPNPGYKAQLINTGNYLDDYATYMSDFAKERYGQDTPTAFWRTILRSEQGISNEEDTSYYNNPGGMDYSPYMSREFGGSYRDIIDNGGAAHRIATFDTIEHGLQAQVDYFLNPETHDWAKEEMELIKQGRTEEAFRIHNKHYVGSTLPLEQGVYWGAFHEEFARGNVRTGDDKRTKLTPKSHAHGNEYVPYDNYPALLHKGERVLTRLEANQLRDLPGMYLPPELQIDENNDSIPTRKQKRAAQEQYQYDTSHTFTGSSTDVLQGFLNEKSNSGNDTLKTQLTKYKTMTLHQIMADQGYDPRSLYTNSELYKLFETSKRESRQHPHIPLRRTRFNWTTPPFVAESKSSEPRYSFDKKQPDIPTGLELLLSLKSQTDELGNLLYGKDSGYNKITGDETNDVAHLKHMAQLRNTSTTDAMIRYYAANGFMPYHRPIAPTVEAPSQLQPESTVTPGTTRILPQDKPKSQPFQWITNLLKILGGGNRFSGIASGLSDIISGKDNPASWISLGTGLLGMKYGKKQVGNLDALSQNLEPLFQMLGVKVPSHNRTNYAGTASNPISDFMRAAFNKDGSINLDSGIWTSPGWPQPAKGTRNPISDFINLGLGTWTSPGWPQPAKGTQNPISDFMRAAFNKDGSINLDSGIWTSPGWPQPTKGTQRTSSVKPIPKTSKKPSEQPAEQSTKSSSPDKSITRTESEKNPNIPKETPQTQEKTESQIDSTSAPPPDIPKSEDTPVVPKDQETNKTPKPKEKKTNWLQQSLQYVGIAARLASRFGLLGGKHHKTLSTVGKFLGGLFVGSHALDGWQKQAFNKDGSINLDSGIWTSPGWPQPAKSEKIPDVLKDEATSPTIPKPPNLAAGEPITKENPTQGLNQPTSPAQVMNNNPPVDTSSAGMNADSINLELTVHVDGKIDGMTETNQGEVVAAMVSQFKQPDWLRSVSNGFMRRANR